MSSSAGGRNGKIELYRFIFCLYVLFFHYDKYFFSLPETWGEPIDLALFPHGAIGVEFFFVTSGWLMASSVYKKRKRSPETAGQFVPGEGLVFLKRKFMAMLPQRIPAFVLAYISFVALNRFSAYDAFIKAVCSVPSFFLIQISGYRLIMPNHVEWYISAMLVAMAVIYPLLVKYYESFTRYIAPLFSLFIIGYLMYIYSSLSGVWVWTGHFFKPLLRAVSEVALGTTAFEVSRYLSENKTSRSSRMKLTLLEAACFMGTTAYVLFTFDLDLEPYALAAIFLMVAIAFSGVSYGSDKFNNGLCCFLGKLSLPIYLSQVAAINFTLAYFEDRSGTEQSLIATALMVVITTAVMLIGAAIKRTMNKKNA